jgi:hypothetical protein
LIINPYTADILRSIKNFANPSLLPGKKGTREFPFSHQNKVPTEKLKVWVLSPSLFIMGTANSNRIGTGPNHCGIII